MDIYKWTMKLGPLVPGELLLDTFDLALDIGRVDMQASPYDVSEYGLPPVKIETPEGKSEYAMAVVSYDDETQIVVPVQGFLPQVFTFSSPPFVESSQLERAPPIDGPIDPWVGHVDLAPHRLPTSEPRV